MSHSSTNSHSIDNVNQIIRAAVHGEVFGLLRDYARMTNPIYIGTLMLQAADRLAAKGIIDKRPDRMEYNSLSP